MPRTKITRRSLALLPCRPTLQSMLVASILIVPSKRLHDSGYNLMQFYGLTAENVPFVNLGGASDVCHLGGLAVNFLVQRDINKGICWTLDCIDGFLRVFARGPGGEWGIICGPSLSDFSVTVGETLRPDASPPHLAPFEFAATLSKEEK